MADAVLKVSTAQERGKARLMYVLSSLEDERAAGIEPAAYTPGPTGQVFSGPSLDTVSRLAVRQRKILSSSASHSAISQGLQSLFQECIPSDVRFALANWASDPEPDTLIVQVEAAPAAVGVGGKKAQRASTGPVADGDVVHSLPWELLPDALQLGGLIVARMSPKPPGAEKPAPAEGFKPKLLLAAVVGLGSQISSSVVSEKRNIQERFGDALSVTAIDLDQLFQAARDLRPTLLHVAGAESAALSEERIQEGLKDLDCLHLAVLNFPGSNRYGSLLSGQGTVSIGRAASAGQAAGDLAADFALYFYSRLLESHSPLDALRSFYGYYSRQDAYAQGFMPIVWLPTPAAKDWKLQPMRVNGVDREKAGVWAGGAQPVAEPSGSGSPQVSIELKLTQGVNPALLINPRPGLNPILEHIKVDSNAPVCCVRLEIQCDTGSGASSVSETLDLEKGPQRLSTDRFHFPVLYDLIRSRAPRRRINIRACLTAQGRTLAESTNSTLWMGPDEWLEQLNQQQLWPYVPSFVLPENQGVKLLLDKAVDVLRLIGVPYEKFDGYQSEPEDGPTGLSREAVVRQIKAVFRTLQQEQINYINPPTGVILAQEGGAEELGQRVRFPDEILNHRRGTCHDLALLLAACAEHVGIHPLVILVPGHTFFGFWTSETEHYEFWGGAHAAGGTPLPAFGDEWMINGCKGRQYQYRGASYSGVQLLEKLSRGGKKFGRFSSVEFVEATWCTYREATFEQACDEGLRRVRKDLKPKGLDVAIDIRQARLKNIQPLAF